jgi:uncharacterized membrane protein
MMMGFGFVTFLIIAGVVIVAALGAGKLLLSSNSSLSNVFSASNKKTSREILEERFVRGEIDREEFNALKVEIEK